MKRYFILIGLPIMLVLLNSSMSFLSEKAPEPEYIILSKEFGLLNMKHDKTPKFIPTSKVPFIENQVYGWIIHIQSKRKEIRWREEFKLPEAPVIWGSDVKGKVTRISADKKTSVIDHVDSTANGFIMNAWALNPGDPAGHHVITVTIEDMEPIVFEFDIDQGISSL